MGAITEEIAKKTKWSERNKKIFLLIIDGIFWTFWFYFIITYLFFWNEKYGQPLIEASEQCTVYCSANLQGTFEYLENSSFNLVWVEDNESFLYMDVGG